MKINYAIVAMAALALVAGCNRGAANNSASSNKATNSANAAAPVAPATNAGGAVDAAFLTAQPWALAGECSEATTFNADGTLQDRAGPGSWTLQGNTLTVIQKGRPQPAIVSRSGDNLVATNPANPSQTMTMNPCPAGSEPATTGNNPDEGADEAEEK